MERMRMIDVLLSSSKLQASTSSSTVYNSIAQRSFIRIADPVYVEESYREMEKDG